jgi:circadian clock protein KaiC
VSAEQPATPIERLPTGSPALDQILGGGLPARSVTIVAGEPGSGKTVLALQLMFHLARQGRKCLYFTTLSEPALKMVRYMQLFGFFDARLLDDRIVFADLGSRLRAEGSGPVLEEVAERVEREEPDLVAIDSFKAIHDLHGHPARVRVFAYDLAVRMAGWGATTLLVGEYTPAEIATLPEFAIADGIVRLSNERQGLTAVRALEVLKLRGADYSSGQHFFEIGPAGPTYYPRVRAPEWRPGPSAPNAERAATGIGGLDELLGGGFPRNSSTVVQGATGTGKTLLGLQFLMEGARRGERGVHFTLDETPEQLRGVAAGFGWDLAALEAGGPVAIRYTSPVELSADRFLNEVRQEVEAAGAVRAVLDSVTGLALGVPSERRFRELVYALVKHLRAAGATLLMTMEVPELLGSAQLTGHGVSSVADNVVLLRYLELGGRLERAVSVLKARGVRHGTELRRLGVEADGLRVGGTFGGFRGVLTGLPSPAAPGAAASRRGAAAGRRKQTER